MMNLRMCAGKYSNNNNNKSRRYERMAWTTNFEADDYSMSAGDEQYCGCRYDCAPRPVN